MSSITTPIDAMVTANPCVDNQKLFNTLWRLNNELFDKVKNRFELQQDPCCSDLQPYCGIDGANGYIGAFTGPEIDWLIHSWTGNPKASFSNIHLSIYLGPHINVPHFGFALGTTPDIFWYMDYIPRTDLFTDTQYLDRYYSGDVNESYLLLNSNDNLSRFISRDVYTRTAQTPCSHCYGLPANNDNIEIIYKEAHRQMDRWLQWVDSAEEVAVEQRNSLAERDFLVRKTICERDPANVIAERLFGKSMTTRLIDTLSGVARQLPRPGGL